MRATLARVWRVLANVLALGLIALAVHSWPAREYVREVAAARATKDVGAPVSIGQVRYSLLSLAFEADDVTLPPSGLAVHGFARRVAVDLSWRAALAGRLDLQAFQVSGLDLVASSRAGGATVELRGLSLSGQGALPWLAGRVRLGGPAAIRLGATTSALTGLDGALAFDGHGLDVSEMRVSSSGLQLEVGGRIDDVLGPAARVSIQGAWRGSVQRLCAAWLRPSASCGRISGTLHGRLALAGALSGPELRVEAFTERMIAGGVPIALDGEALVSSSAIEISRLDAAAFGGSAALRGAVLVGARPRLSGATLTWRGIDLRAVASRTGVDARVVASADGSAMVTGDLTAPAGLRIEGETSLSGWIPAATAGGWHTDLIAELRLEGTLSDPDASGSVHLVASRGDGVCPVTAQGLVHLDASGVQVTALEARCGDNRLAGSLRFQPDTSTIVGEYAATVADLGSLDGVIGGVRWPLRGRGTTTGHIGGTVSRPFVRGTLHASDLEATLPWPLASGDLVRVSAGSVTVAGVFGVEPEWPFDVHLTLRDVAGAGAIATSGLTSSVSRLDAEVALRGRAGRPGDLEGELRLGRADASVHGVDASLASPAHIRVEAGQVTEARLDVNVGGLAVRLARTGPDDSLYVVANGQLPLVVPGLPDGPAVAMDARIDRWGIDISRASARWGNTTAEATAQVPLSFFDRWLPRAPQAPPDEEGVSGAPAMARLEIRSIPVGAATRWLYADAAVPIEGALDMVLDAEADQASLDAVRIAGRIEQGWVEAAGVRLAQDGVAAVALRDRIASVTGWRVTTPGADMTVRAGMTLAAGPPRFEVAVGGDVDLGLALALPDARVAGTAHVDLSAHGADGHVSWQGEAQLRDGAWVSRRRSLALTDMEGRVACAGDGCRVEALTGRLNDGTLAIEGGLPLPGTAPSAALQIALRGAGLDLPRGTRHDVDADLELAGGDAPRLSGVVTIWLGTVSESLVGLAAMVRSLQTSSPAEPSRDALSAALSRVGLDVRIVSGNDLTFDSADLQVTAAADLRVRGTLAAPRLRGELAARERGSIFLAGRRWALEPARVNLLEGARGTDVRVAATLTASISKYVVQIALSGPANGPTVVMTADPPLGQSALAGLVLTGTTTGDPTRAGGQVATLVSTELLSGVGRAVGVDAVRIEQTQSELSTAELEPVSRLTISKRVTPKFEIVFSQGLEESDDLAWVLIWRPRWHAVDLRATIRTNGAEAYEFRQELEFGSPRADATGRGQRRPAPPLVARVDVRGLPPAEETAARGLLSLRAGAPFTTVDWQRDRQALTEHFHHRDRLRVRVRARHTVAADGMYVLAYEITPGPITRLEIQGYDTGRDTDETLRDTWSRVVVEELLTEELSDVLRIELARKGHLGAEVATRLRPLPDGGRLAVIDVVPGPRTRRRSIVFTGNAAVPGADLRQAIAAASAEPRAWLVPSVLEEPVAAVYHRRGYLAARATAARALEDDRATLTVRVEEGARFTVGDVALAGTTSLGEDAARAGVGLVAGAPFTDDALAGGVAGLRMAYARAGYLATEVVSSITVKREDAVVDIAVTVTEGPRSVLREVRVTGGKETSASLVAEALGVEAGGPVDTVALDEGQQRLYQTGIFRTVDVDVIPLEGAEGADRPVQALVTLEERARYRLRYGVQFGPSTIDSITTARNTADPGATIDVQRRNLLGLGIVAGGGGVWSADQHRARATVSASRLRERIVSTTLTVEHANQDRVSDNNNLNIVDRSVRAVLEQRWRFGGRGRIEVAYGLDIESRRLELRATRAQPLPLRGRFAGLHTTFTYDSRDNRLNPRRGTFHTSRIDASAGLWLSDIAFGRYQVQHFAYRPAGAATLASGLRIGLLDVDDARDPASLLLYFTTGGATSVRGYETDELTSGYVLGLPAGGKVLLVLNQEVRVPLTRRLGVVGFIDAGNTFSGLDTFSLRGLKLGAGTGVRLDTPVAVLRFDIGLPLPRPAASPRARWYASIGQAF